MPVNVVQTETERVPSQCSFACTCARGKLSGDKQNLAWLFVTDYDENVCQYQFIYVGIFIHLYARKNMKNTVLHT